MATICDERTNKDAACYVVFTDKFLSGWGMANNGRSLYALACDSTDEAEVVLSNGQRRGDMKRGRIVYPRRGKLQIRLSSCDHLRIVDREQAARWYKPNGF